ncbi:MAG TPA: alpha/beta fold hydrolase [Usitatibacter sp.]|nr:alpha/beta fold hydrolase [Usitatibacter sp.]
MTPIVFLPGFDGDARLRQDFMNELGRQHRVRGVSYPNRKLGTLDGYREHAMGHVPVDWQPFLVAESFSGLVAARWASVDPRVKGVVLCGSFARNPVSVAARLGAALPALVKLTPWLSAPFARASGEPLRVRWSAAYTRSLASLDDEVVAERLRLIAAEDVGRQLAALAVPVVIVQFEGDQVVGSAAQAHLESVCHNAQVLRLPGPHFAIETKPRECAQAIGETIRALAPKTA